MSFCLLGYGRSSTCLFVKIRSLLVVWGFRFYIDQIIRSVENVMIRSFFQCDDIKDIVRGFVHSASRMAARTSKTALLVFLPWSHEGGFFFLRSRYTKRTPLTPYLVSFCKVWNLGWSCFISGLEFRVLLHICVDNTGLVLFWLRHFFVLDDSYTL